jgi:hypothetical protein
MGPSGPLTPGGQTIKHGPRRIHVSDGEVSLGARRTERNNAGNHNRASQHKGPGIGSRWSRSKQRNQIHGQLKSNSFLNSNLLNCDFFSHSSLLISAEERLKSLASHQRLEAKPKLSHEKDLENETDPQAQHTPALAIQRTYGSKKPVKSMIKT